ncbi:MULTISPECIES: SIS domain-containing protein [unclassified Micromonospora]|uniref:SIS domain-containing protein n=1 Tax=unclassified Micromonospora TaxID=2617518 RepID=UPI00331F0818
MTVGSAEFVRKVEELIPLVAQTGRSGVRSAADLIYRCISDGGVVQTFGTGHSEALAMEITARAGGLVPTNRLALRDLVTFGGRPPEDLADPLLERDPGVAQEVFDLAAPKPEDVFVIASNSGANGSVVEMARIAKRNGNPLIAITSVAHSSAVESRHASGQKLVDLADVVLDNHAPYGDAILTTPDGVPVCGVSSITAALLAQMIVADVVATMIEAGDQPPVYLSANIPGGHERNTVLEARYAGRIRRVGA